MRHFPSFVAALLVTGGVALSSGPAVVADAVPYTDAAGDGGELDVTTTLVDTDPGTEAVSIAVNVTGLHPATMDSRRRNLQIYLTPEPAGAELALVAMAEQQQLTPYVAHPTPTNWHLESLPPTIRFSHDGNVLTWVLDKSELGESTGFRFLLYTQIPDSAGTWHVTDHAPDVGWWRYQYSTSAPPPAPPRAPSVARPVLGPPAVTPLPPRAGRRLTVVLSVRRSDDGAPLTTGHVVCDPTIAGSLVKHTESFANGKVRLSLVVPKSAKGRLLRVRVKVINDRQSATKIVTYKVS